MNDLHQPAIQVGGTVRKQLTISRDWLVFSGSAVSLERTNSARFLFFSCSFATF